MQSVSTLIGGFIIGLAFAWQLGLVGIACTPLLVSAGYIRLRVVVLKDQQNKKAHESSAQLACEAAASIRTVASLTREEDCCKIYSKSLEEPLRVSNRSAVWSNLVYALSQSMSFYVIALVFWYGSLLVSDEKVSTFHFFIALMVSPSPLQFFLFYLPLHNDRAPRSLPFKPVTYSPSSPDVSSAQNSAADIITLLDSVPEIDSESTEGKIPQNVEGRIRFEDVHFRYPTRPGVRVLRNLNLTVEPGTYIALVGASGCGKSTTYVYFIFLVELFIERLCRIQLIERFYDPLAGTVYVSFSGRFLSLG